MTQFHKSRVFKVWKCKRIKSYSRRKSKKISRTGRICLTKHLSRANFGLKGAKFGARWVNLGHTWVNLGHKLANLTLTLASVTHTYANLGLILAESQLLHTSVGLILAKIGFIWVNFELIWANLELIGITWGFYGKNYFRLWNNHHDCWLFLAIIFAKIYLESSWWSHILASKVCFQLVIKFFIPQHDRARLYAYIDGRVKWS